jgi:hypothetical protein
MFRGVRLVPLLLGTVSGQPRCVASSTREVCSSDSQQMLSGIVIVASIVWRFTRASCSGATPLATIHGAIEVLDAFAAVPLPEVLFHATKRARLFFRCHEFTLSWNVVPQRLSQVVGQRCIT